MSTDSLYFRHLRAADDAGSGVAHRARLLEAMTRACAEKGYGDVTISHVVALAGVSRRTFYEHFSSKEECLLDAYATGSAAVMDEIAGAVRASGTADWRERVRVGLTTYADTLAAAPELANMLFIDVMGAGPRTTELRRQARDGYAALYRSAPGSGPADDDPLRDVPIAYRRAVVGAVAELVRTQIDDHGAASLPGLAPTLADVAIATLEAGRSSTAR